ncbi:hypothetical protein MRB53_035236 [Persea americana]|uniref:Uncharacterized protein n=1 Tax=Persea americana TaxID=3435 RepID=A0ACC2K414_PERAE|nr:hypothetical protein MRB53_035236 [Persea americana]
MVPSARDAKTEDKVASNWPAILLLTEGVGRNLTMIFSAPSFACFPYFLFCNTVVFHCPEISPRRRSSGRRKSLTNSWTIEQPIWVRSGIMAAKEINLKLLVYKEKNQILYAESDKDFVDLLFSFLTTPVATIIRLTAKQAKIGSMSTLYESLEDLDVQYLQTESCKNMLLHPMSASEEHCRDLVVNIDEREPIEYYFCEASLPFRSDTKYLISTSLSEKQCYSGVTKKWKISKEESKNGARDGKDGVFVKGRMRYIITDDLQVSPVCIGTTLEMLESLGISDATVLEERNVNLGSEEEVEIEREHGEFSLASPSSVDVGGKIEALSMLKASLISNTVLSDVFLKKPKQLGRRSSLCC